MKNLHSTQESTLIIAEIVCDRCGITMPAESAEFHSALSVNQYCEGKSVFGEGKLLRIDLCPNCIQETLGPWLRVIEPIANSQIQRMTEFILKIQDSFANDQTAIDTWLDTECSGLGGESPHAFLERTGETEPIVQLLRTSSLTH
ncbi:MAG: hypothetical protein P4L87_22370 [Formivibrio sp.]|nr:hypothetical protein [Formivibrio sp.]